MKITEREINFMDFLNKEGFIYTVDKRGSFERGTRLFYKRHTPESFLAFNVFREETKTSFFTTDFWLVVVKSEDEFLERKILSVSLIDVRLGFELKRDYSLYSKL